MEWEIYLSGEIHTKWRQEIIEGSDKKNLPIIFSSAVTDHEASDSAGDMLGRADSNFWRDHQSSKINSIRTRTMIDRCDLAVIKFGEKYKQWNAAAMTWAETTEQVVEILDYVTTKE